MIAFLQFTSLAIAIGMLVAAIGIYKNGGRK